MKTDPGRYRWVALLCVCVLTIGLTGCGQYQMRGIVIEGAVSAIRVVKEDDPRLLEGPGLPMATIDAAIDPERLSRIQLPRGVSDIDGTFGIPVDETGAGYLDYYVRVIVRRAGYDTAVEDIRVPGPHQRLLVTLARGEDRYKPDAPDVLNETLEMSKPYMR